MNCDRCNYNLNFVYEQVIEEKISFFKKNVSHIQEYYCPRM